MGLARQVRSREESLAGFQKSMTCHLGDFTEYSRLRRELSDAENIASRSTSRARKSIAEDSLSRLLPGDVVDVPTGRAPGYAVVLGSDHNSREPRPAVLTLDNQLRRIGLQDLEGPITPVTRVRIPKSFNAKVPKSRKDLASSVRNAIRENRPPAPGNARNTEFGRASALPDVEKRINDLRLALRSHPCHGCSEREDHARWSERWWKLRRETDGLVREIQGRTNTIAKTFDRVCDLLSSYGYLETSGSGKVTINADGQKLRRIYGEKDLLISQSLRQGAFSDLDATEVAALASVLVYQAKREERGLRPRMPSVSLETAVDIVVRGWSVLEDAEEENKLPLTGSRNWGSSGRSLSGPRASISRKSSTEPTWPRGTLSGGSNRLLTCWTSWRRSRAWIRGFHASARRRSSWFAAAWSPIPPWSDATRTAPTTSTTSKAA